MGYLTSYGRIIAYFNWLFDLINLPIHIKLTYCLLEVVSPLLKPYIHHGQTPFEHSLLSALFASKL